jgi:hypothetical protein
VVKLKREAKKEENSNRLRGFKKWTVLAAAVALPLFACSKKQPENHTSSTIRCYDNKNKQLHSYVENETQDKSEELGKEFSIDVSQLGVSDPDPLAFFCTHSGHLFWITNEYVHIRKLSLEKGHIKASKVLDARHVDPDEFQVPGVKVMSADIWRNPDEAWQNLTVATLTNTGLFQIARYSLKGAARNKPDRGIYDLASKLKPESRWPRNGVVGGSIRALGNTEFVALPVGEEGKGKVDKFYHISVHVKPGELIASSKLDTTTITPWEVDSDLKNIIEISSPIRYDGSLGGWVVNLVAEKENGETEPVFPIVTPDE